MEIIAEMWGDYTEFVLGELRGILEGEKKAYKFIMVDEPVIVINTESASPLRRAGLLRRVSSLLYTGKEVPSLNINLDDYAIRVRKNGKWSATEIIRALGSGINGKANLENPENIVRVYACKNIYVGIEIKEGVEQDFEVRRSKNLPISYPITMHPRLARAMINIARVKRGAKILDPFCGTGTILLEGSLMGMDMHGSDLDERMLRASETNLKKFGMKANLTRRDVGEIEGNYDAIVTDPPYGRSSSSMGEKLNELYERAFKRFSDVTDKVSIVLPESRAVEIGKKYFNLREMFPVRVHKSLTRYYCFFERE